MQPKQKKKESKQDAKNVCGALCSIQKLLAILGDSCVTTYVVALCKHMQKILILENLLFEYLTLVLEYMTLKLRFV